MDNLLFENRMVTTTDWATILFLLCFALIASNRQLFYAQFNDFVKLPVNDKFLKIYKEPEHLRTWFFISLYVVQIISFSFIIQIALSAYGYTTKDNFISFVRIITVLNFFVLSKHFCEKIIANTFNIDDIEHRVNLYKAYHRNYLGLIALPIALIGFYNNVNNLTSVNIIICLLLIINLVNYLNGIKNYKKAVFSNFLYFILYLCALEIAPYFFMYYFFTKS
ncbi:DUF4271 domain-containing protein [Flavobacterium agricola]|uniref:DUF4271 domain-containing protein n=1 Tax=Flavobacterium agricola TaxID=2870839 RepID=A0ABY6LYL4_9FLAO|nr:DUF4271 domain-containing protein [Flavobacterium agricola]UYW01276.1 DUF4271 domain-containing protein [Flavobacterium agricola]